MSNTVRAKRDPEGRKSAIIGATTELIAEVGINAVNHRKIAERAGVPLGATTQYFTSREDLIRSALEHMAAEFGDDLVRLDADLTVSTDRIQTVAQFFLRYLNDVEPAHAASAFFLANLHDPQLAEVTKQWDQQQAAVLAAHFDARFAEAAGTYAYGLYAQASTASTTASEESLLWVLGQLASEAGS